MLIQRGKFTINSMSEIATIDSDKDGIKKVIDLNYMGKFEFEGNAIPISRMFFEYYRNEYEFIPMNVYNKNKEQLYIFFNKEVLKDQREGFLQGLFEYIYSRECSLYDYINNPDNCSTNFWWSIDSDYMLFFGEEKKEIIKYFIDACYNRDGKEEGIKKKLVKAGYKL